MLALLPAEAAVQLRGGGGGVTAACGGGGGGVTAACGGVGGGDDRRRAARRRRRWSHPRRAEALVAGNDRGVRRRRRWKDRGVRRRRWRSYCGVRRRWWRELPRRAEAAYAPRWLEACSQEALKRCRTADCRRCYPWRYRCRWWCSATPPGKRMIARQSCSVAGAGLRTGGAGTHGAR